MIVFMCITTFHRLPSGLMEWFEGVVVVYPRPANDEPGSPRAA